MDKNKIKSFAIWARRNLISAVSERANRIGVTEDKILNAVAVQGGFKLEGKDEIFKLSKEHRDKLVKEVNEKGFEQVMEEVAYTWFNRFMGLRYMEVNEYLPTGVRVLSSEVEGKTEPDVLTRVSEVIDELGLNAEYIYELLDSGKTEDREEAYKHILVRQCNELGKIIPQMFEKISDYTELLLPDNLLEEGSVIRKMVEDIEEEDWKEEVEIIGWMYQYYISEKKDKVFAALKKNVKITKENIPAATQLFTPKWIVKYMVENSLGRLWLEGHANEELQKEWKYYLEEAQQEPEVEEELKKIREEHAKLTPEDIKLLDPCMGSGHILVYAFDVLYEIYKTAGYSEREIPRMILQNNLYGLDIDDRAAQLASFALVMKARHYNRRLFREIERQHLELNICSIQESNLINEQLSMNNGQLIDYFCNINGVLNEELKNDFQYLVNVFVDAKEYGSILEVEKVNFEALKQRLKEIEQEDNFMFGDYRKMLLDKLPMIIKQAEVMSKKYDICVTNPPYMASGGMNNKLKGYVEKNYKSGRSDLYTVFIEKCLVYTKENTFTSMVTMHSWMFLSTFKKLRDYILKRYTIDSILHLGMEAFENIIGKVVQTASFVIRKNYMERYKSSNVRLVDFYDSRRYEKESQFFNKENLYQMIEQYQYNKIPDSVIAYWCSKGIIEAFESGKTIDNYINMRVGLDTGNNDKFVRLWFEIEENKFGRGLCSKECFFDKGYKWVPHTKGGAVIKWYGNVEYVLAFDKENYKLLSESGNNLPSREFYFLEGLNWTRISSSKFGVRYIPKGYVFNSACPTAFANSIEQLYYFIAFLNTKITYDILQLLNPTLNFQVGTVSSLPIIEVGDEMVHSNIVKKTMDNIHISRNNWDSFETAWDFKIHPLLKFLDKGQQYNLESIFRIWETECAEAFEQLKYNEEELNRIFIDIYGLQDELTPEVEDKDITIRKADRERDVKSFISYAVGCMLGRYSIGTEGLIYAGGEFKDKWNLDEKKVRKIEKDDDGNIISDSWVDATFMPDRDNVIPITEDEYFEDDIVARFIDFVRTVYGEETLEENLDFIADSIGRKASETARQAIRRYFIKDFYKDHLKVYQKRPIYWMFESGKNDGFKALVYMHRYNEQTVARVRTDYLHTLQRKYEAEIERQQLIVDSEEYTAKDRTAAKKKIAKIAKQIEECREYDQVVAHLANEKISIDLDDGVKVNYDKFQGIKVINSKDKEVKMNLLAKI
ncbi:BREX-1 system adenine-specific DNA-methyltransferase PglX [Clostridium botulinum]|uniref:BREX-1 system adenine-specific DNA-methyltransferase PglX n=1 Tax=Clostridium botulinum TaxID=1491 RepID=UPI003DA4DEA2